MKNNHSDMGYPINLLEPGKSPGEPGPVLKG